MEEPMSFDRWALTLAGLMGEPLPALPDITGRRIACRDEPLSAADLADITSPSELGRVLGISRQAAALRLKRPTLHLKPRPTSKDSEP